MQEVDIRKMIEIDGTCKEDSKLNHHLRKDMIGLLFHLFQILSYRHYFGLRAMWLQWRFFGEVMLRGYLIIYGRLESITLQNEIWLVCGVGQYARVE